ncbi:5-oxoprolinase subunit C family protein [Rossellomorea aquimaris]|uniref:5-oxoprolinase subunit C family protein n=1 Tax=Rossellomorea aquimaris TaxID=189382 RepID=UPI0007D07BBC|nr:biotin-dependent carboxyltransferase family protein [Rossellomorea aquimaris]
MINVVKSGLLSSIQDSGRYGFQRYGVIVSGSMDPLAHKIANLLVGNQEDEATIEITLVGPVLTFQKTSLISICGGDLSPSINGEPVPLWRSLLIKAGSELRFGPSKNGCRSYLSVAGGVELTPVMKSKSTYLRAGIGGFEGRPLKANDELKIGPLSKSSADIVDYLTPFLKERSFTEIDWSISSEFISTHQPDQPIRVIEGPEYKHFTKESQQHFFQQPFKVSPQSDRMGYRLSGSPLKLEKDFDMISEAVTFGTIQVPADGNPIILLADRQTTGGYPRIGHVASIDLPIIAQTKPGEKLSFTSITHEEAQQLYLDREKQIRHLKQGISLKFNR